VLLCVLASLGSGRRCGRCAIGVPDAAVAVHVRGSRLGAQALGLVLSIHTGIDRVIVQEAE